MDEFQVLKISMYNRLVGYLLGFKSGKSVLMFTDDFRFDSHRPTFTLTTSPRFPGVEKILSNPWLKNQRLHPVLSNLLPEGALREWMTSVLKIHADHEFKLLTYLGKDLPGAIVFEPAELDEIPDSVRSLGKAANIVPIEENTNNKKFSLAGVQMKFSMQEKEGRFNLYQPGDQGTELGNWIVKTPSTIHREVPANEFTAMSLAQTAGIQIPEIHLVKLDQLINLPPINLPNENYALAVKRFDRKRKTDRIHMEDFAQVFVKYSHAKYDAINYVQIGKVIYQYSRDGLSDLQQMARRLLVNILLANGDAHLKNWSFLYADRVTPKLSPAYDIVTTSVYIKDEKHHALNMGKNKDWYQVSNDHFMSWVKSVGVDFRVIKAHLKDTIEKARELWPNQLKDLPMLSEHKDQLKAHWRRLQKEFRIHS